jgi:microcystin-dependent protein
MALTFDDHKNFAYSVVAVAPVPATSGTSLEVAPGDGAKFPTAPFNAVVWPASVQPTTANAEVIRVTAKATDTFTIVRTQEGSSARTIGVNDQISNNITDKALTDIEAAFVTAGMTTAPVGGAIMWFTTVAPTGWLILDGSAVSRTTYSELFALWGGTFGSGDGSTTFNIPDMRQRIPIGRHASVTSIDTIGETTGSWDHTHGPGSLAVASHTHGPGTLTVASHTHGPGSLQAASHTHGPGTLGVASHSHDDGTLETDSQSVPHTHDLSNHTHTFTTNTSGTLNNAEGGVAFSASTDAHTHTGTTDGPSSNSTGAASSTAHEHDVSGSTGSTAPSVTSGLTASTAPLVNTGVTDATAPAVNAGATAGTAPAVSTGVTAAANPPVLVVNFIVRAFSTI